MLQKKSNPGLERLNVMVVDDSATVRQIMLQLLSRDARISVVTCADALIALRKMEKQRPDVIITDLELPNLHGLEFVRRVMQRTPVPIIVCSSHAMPGAHAALQALMEGAVEVIAKPRVGIKAFLEESAQLLLESVWQVSQSKVRKPLLPGQQSVRTTAHVQEHVRATGARSLPSGAHQHQVVAIGASIGGTEAIRSILQSMPLDCPGIVVVQHMPELFTRAFAEHLNRDCAIKVKEAESGDLVLPGRALIAPGSRHMELRSSGHGYSVELNLNPPVSRHRPSVDVLFTSVARAAGAQAQGILLTGMGRDGAEGLLHMRRAGAGTIAQNEATCIVFGMPCAAIELGAACEVLPLHEIPAAML